MNDRIDFEGEIAIEPERYEFFEGPAYRFELDRRDFLKAMGGGLLVLCLLDRDADDAGRNSPAVDNAGAAAGAARRGRRTSAPGCTSARTAGSRSIRARPRWARTSGPPSPKPSPRSCARPYPRSTWSWPTRN